MKYRTITPTIKNSVEHLPKSVFSHRYCKAVAYKVSKLKFCSNNINNTERREQQHNLILLCQIPNLFVSLLCANGPICTVKHDRRPLAQPSQMTILKPTSTYSKPILRKPLGTCKRSRLPRLGGPWWLMKLTIGDCSSRYL